MNSAINLIENNELKIAFKAALLEILEERRDLFSDIIQEVIEDIAFSNAIKEGETSETISRSPCVITLEPDVQAYFPDSETVNATLRALIRLIPTT